MEEKIHKNILERDGVLFQNEEQYATNFVPSKQCPVKFFERFVLHKIEKIEDISLCGDKLIDKEKVISIIKSSSWAIRYAIDHS